MTVESRLPSLPDYQAFLEGARRLSDNAGTIQEDCQRPWRMDAISVVEPTERYNTATLPRSPQISITRSPFEGYSACKSSSFYESEYIAVRQRNLGQWPGCSHILTSFQEQPEHEALSHRIWVSSDSASLANENKIRRRTRGALEATLPAEETRQRVSRNDVHYTGNSGYTKTGSSVSSKALRASSGRATFKIDNSNMDQVVQHKVKEDKVAHKRAEQIRRNEHSSFMAALEHCLHSDFLNGCQPTDQSQVTRKTEQ